MNLRSLPAVSLVLVTAIASTACVDPPESKDDSGEASEPSTGPADLDEDGVTVEDGDCDDADPSVYPGADDAGVDGVDQDCDGLDGPDGDGDGYVDASAGGDDCDDAEPSTYPGAQEDYSDGVDQDCDGEVDRTDVSCSGSFVFASEAAGEHTLDPCNDWSMEIDHDMFPDAAPSVVGFQLHLNGSEDPAFDCAISIAQSEVCGLGYYRIGAEHEGQAQLVTVDCAGLDADSRGTVAIEGYMRLESLATATDPGSYVDLPIETSLALELVGVAGDFSVAGSVVLSAVQAGRPDVDATGCAVDSGDEDSDGHVNADFGGTDCDDADSGVSPDATELCNDIDDDCDGTTDEDDAVDALTWYVDADGDEQGDASAPAMACEQPEGYVASDADCDDADPTIFTAAPELCDGQLNDCAGIIGEEEVDDDVDGYVICTLDAGGWDGSGTVVGGDDCDDTDATVYPSAAELCDGQLNDCAGVIGSSEVDSDLDGYAACTLDSGGWDGAGSVVSGDDCDDTDGTVYPSAAELCDGQLNDCSGAIGADEVDGDVDGYALCSLDSGGWDGTGSIVGGDDCDDGDDTVYPSADELCDGQLNDCSGTIGADEIDSDLDTYVVCTLDAGGWDGTGTVVGGDDCDDREAAVSPGATETCNTIDDDCDSDIDESSASDAVDWYADTDGDSFGDALVVERACYQPSNYVADSTDCDDADGSVNPSAIEVCDIGDTDEDCSGLADDLDPSVDTTTMASFYTDADTDGYGSGTAVQACDAPSGMVLDATDCDDGDIAVNPGATEVCADGIDNDCSGDATGCMLTGELFATYGDYDVEVTGRYAADFFGASVTVADLSGDGRNDLLVGSVGYAVGASGGGAVFLMEGPITGGTSAGAAATILGSASGVGIGGDSVSPGDLDGDGYDDLVVHTGYQGFRTYLGPLSGTFDATASDGEGAFGVTGVDSVGDLNGDGFEDLFLSAPTSRVVYGPLTGTVSSAAVGGSMTMSSYSAFAVYASGGAPAGDLNGDGVTDFVQSGEASGTNGLAAVFYGPVSGSLGYADADAWREGESSGDQLGMSTTYADLNKDGADDLVLAAPNNDEGELDAGAAYVVLGPVTGSVNVSTADAKLLAAEPYQLVGIWGWQGRSRPLHAPGDVNYDGFEDLMIGAAGNTSTAGKLFVVTGPFSGTRSLDDAELVTGASPSGGNAYWGSKTAVGDVNNDGVDDIIFGFPLDDGPRNNQGAIFVAHGIAP